MATGEVTLEGAHAELVGVAERGFAQMTAMLNITRLHNAITAAAIMRRAVMLARALEHLLKVLLKNRKVTVPAKATLGSLVDLYRKTIGDDQILEKVLEVANMDRVISAHDIPPYDKQMDVKDANHAWTALDIALRELPWSA